MFDKKQPSKPFSNSTFLTLVERTVGANADIPAPVLGFIAFKLAQLLAQEAWNVIGARVDDHDQAGYRRYLQLAIAQRGTVLKPSVLPQGVLELWIRVTHPPPTVCVPFLPTPVNPNR